MRGVKALRACGAGRLVFALGFCLLSKGASAAFTCGISTPGLSFGSYDVFAVSSVNGTGTLSVTCSLIPPANDGNVSYVISLSTGSSNSFVQRKMFSGANALLYNLYTGNTYSVVWGDGTGSSQTVSGTMKLNKFTNPSQTVMQTVYGQIPALQDAAVGNVTLGNPYLDNVTATVSF
ncbi:MAG TPA: spore coat U domain-containing protein [Casimicrobiaceae bacterium]|jgi:spore coat protein U-like protein|nr:spore coat U domain-containing protein [Casimicrobiaceae bacterium]